MQTRKQTERQTGMQTSRQESVIATALTSTGVQEVKDTIGKQRKKLKTDLVKRSVIHNRKTAD